MSGTGLIGRHLYLHICQLMTAASLDLSWCCGPENPCVAPPSGLDLLTLWQPQGNCTSSVKPQGSKSEHPSEQGSVTSADRASEVSKPLSVPFYWLQVSHKYFGHLVRRVDSLGRLWCWEGLGAGGEGDDRGWDGWMASPTQWTWVWVNSGSWWWTGRPGVLRFMDLQRVGHDWMTELNWTELKSQTCPDLMGEDSDPISDGGIVKRPVAIFL